MNIPKLSLLTWMALVFVGLSVPQLLNSATAIADDNGVVVVSSWGGNFQKGQREALFDPFEKATGIKVIEDTEPTDARIKAMVESGNTTWDVAEVTGDSRIILERGGFLENINYDQFDKEILANIDPHLIKPNGIGALTYAQAIAYSTKAFSADNHPRTWAEFWDLKRFPGPRMLNAQTYIVPALEVALLADGVKPKDLYPLDFKRAYKSLDKIRPSVVKWADSSAGPSEALISGDAVLVLTPLGRLVTYKDQGAPVDIEWNQSMVQYDYWVIPKGAKNADNAMKFLEFVSRPEQQAKFAELQLYGPTNKKAFDLISPERALLLPGNPAIEAEVFWMDYEFWAATDAAGKTNVEKNIELWNAWINQ